MSITPIQWTSNKHRWAVIRYFNNPSESDWVSQHSTPREAVLRCQEWIQGDPWTYPEGDGILNHYYDVEARDPAAALDLAVARHQVATEDAAAGRASRFPRFEEAGGKLLQPGVDDEEPEEPIAVSATAIETAKRWCHRPRYLRRSTNGIAHANNLGFRLNK